MEQTPLPVRTLAPLRNVARFSGLVNRLLNTAADLPRMAVFWGCSGYGKSSAAIFSANKARAYCIEVKSVWTRRHACRMILAEMGEQRPAGSIPEMVDQIGQELSRSGRPLIIDDAQLLFSSAAAARMIRDIYKSAAGAPIILIGEQDLLGHLKVIENIDSLMLDRIEAVPVDLADGKHLARIYCPAVTVAEDLLAKTIAECGGSTRRICVNLDKLRDHAATVGKSALALGDLPADWAFFKGQDAKLSLAKGKH
jgi:hypothetical protein